MATTAVLAAVALGPCLHRWPTAPHTHINLPIVKCTMVTFVYETLKYQASRRCLYQVKDRSSWSAPTSHPLALCCQIPLFVFYWFLPHCFIPTLCDLLHFCCHPTHFILRNFALDLQPTETQIRQFYNCWFFPVSKIFRDSCFCTILLVACLFSTQVFYWAHEKLPPYSTS